MSRAFLDLFVRPGRYQRVYVDAATAERCRAEIPLVQDAGGFRLAAADETPTHVQRGPVLFLYGSPRAARPRTYGVGTELKALLAPLGFPPCSACDAYAAQLDRWGVAGCRERRNQIAAWLRAQARKVGHHQEWFPYEELADEAIARAEAYLADAVQFDASGHNGLGDHFIQLALGTGYKDAHPGRTVLLNSEFGDWLDLFDSGCHVVSSFVGGVPFVAAMNGKYSHWHQADPADRRCPWDYCAAIAGCAPRIPPLRPLPDDALRWAEQYRGAVVLAPFTARSIRTWPIMHWLRLERLLLEAGCSVVIADDREERCQPFRSPKLIREAPARVAALLRAAALTVANESGFQHVAGMVGTPAVVLASVFPGFTALYPTHTVLAGNLGCEWCRQHDPPRPGLPSRAEIGCVADGDQGRCASLASITPERVLAEVQCQLRIHAITANTELRNHLRRYAPDAQGGHPRSDRRTTTLPFMEHLRTRPAPLAVETGCQREANDYGAGMSSTVYGMLLRELGGRLVSLELSAERAAFAASVTRGLPVEVVHTDSRAWLTRYQGPAIDGLYLDSADVGTPGYTDCCLDEARAALPHLAPDARLLIDDTWAHGDGWAGKGEKAVPWLLAQGWRVVAQGYQVLLRRGP